jgi:Fe-S-cluster containining protein
MDKKFVDKHKTHFQIVPEKIVGEKDRISFLTSDLACVFLNRETRLCSVYEDRPNICRAYGMSDNQDLQCPYFKKSGNPRSEASRKKIERHFDKLFNKLINGKEIWIKRKY